MPNFRSEHVHRKHLLKTRKKYLLGRNCIQFEIFFTTNKHTCNTCLYMFCESKDKKKREKSIRKKENVKYGMQLLFALKNVWTINIFVGQKWS